MRNDVGCFVAGDGEKELPNHVCDIGDVVDTCCNFWYWNWGVNVVVEFKEGVGESVLGCFETACEDLEVGVFVCDCG